MFSTQLDFINSFPQLPYSSWTSTLCVVGSMAGLVQQLLTVITLLMCEKIDIYIHTIAAFNFVSYPVILSAESVNESTISYNNFLIADYNKPQPHCATSHYKVLQ